MSRSRRYHTIFGGAASARDGKKIWGGIERARAKDHLRHERWEMAEVRQLSTGQAGWCGPKEGRSYHSPYEDICHCQPHWIWPCWWCFQGGYRSWFTKQMRK